LAPPIDEQLRGFVAKRAAYRCEYCLIHEDDSFSKHQIDHIVSRKHGGSSDEANLAFACVRCNAWKGTDIAAVDHAFSIRGNSGGKNIFGWTESSSSRSQPKRAQPRGFCDST
jgi:hypothetical protein